MTYRDYLDKVDVPVSREKIFLSDGTEIPRREAIVAERSRDVLGVVSPRYQVIPHTDILDTIGPVLENSGAQCQSVSLSPNSSRMFAKFRWPDEQVEIRPGDSVNPEFVLTNSLDGSLMVGLLLGAFRMVCSNGLIVGVKLIQARFKHTSGLDASGFGGVVSASVNIFQSEIIPRWQYMSQSRIDGQSVLARLIESEPRPLPLKLLEAVQQDTAMGEIGLWEFYNSFTRFLTHEYGRGSNRRTPSEQRILEINLAVSRIVEPYIQYPEGVTPIRQSFARTIRPEYNGASEHPRRSVGAAAREPRALNPAPVRPRQVQTVLDKILSDE